MPRRNLTSTLIHVMGLMGLGGLIAIIGGILFVYLVLQAVVRGGRANRTGASMDAHRPVQSPSA